MHCSSRYYCRFSSRIAVPCGSHSCCKRESCFGLFVLVGKGFLEKYRSQPIEVSNQPRIGMTFAGLGMSDEQLSALLGRLQDDAGLREQIQAAATADAVVAIAQKAGFVISESDWLNYQDGQQSEGMELSEDDVEGITGGGGRVTHRGRGIFCTARVACKFG